jgi:hypothetical protein
MPPLLNYIFIYIATSNNIKPDSALYASRESQLLGCYRFGNRRIQDDKKPVVVLLHVGAGMLSPADTQALATITWRPPLLLLLLPMALHTVMILILGAPLDIVAQTHLAQLVESNVKLSVYIMEHL